jgi:Negative regulator of beta-lactamase expression
MDYQIIQQASSNFSSRKGRSIIAIVNHQTAGQAPGCVSWLCNPAAQASAHYVVTREGEIYQVVADENAAWHAGAVANPSWGLYDGTNPNRCTIGIEHECYPAVGGDGNLTEAQYQATLWLHKQLTAKWNIPVDREHIIGHYQIDRVNRPNCPGAAFPWDRLMADLNQQPINVSVSGMILNGFLWQDRSYGPAKTILGALGATYTWDDSTSSIVVNGQCIPVAIQGDTGFALVSQLAEAVGKKAAWDGVNNMVIIG